MKRSSARNRFLDHFASAIEAGDAALFVGAGLSQPAGYVNWKELLRGIAEDLNLDVEVESDLVALAQYHLNVRSNRAHLNRRLVEEFTKKARATENHRLIAQLPVRTIWTTNYDTLLEDALRAAGKRVDVKSTNESLAVSIPGRHAVIYKMHGDISQPHLTVLTKEDYETYDQSRGLFASALQGDLVSKSFLFLGFSFTDPNIDYILSRVRVLLRQNQREHYCVMKRLTPPRRNTGRARAQHEYDATKMALRIADLRRYSIEAVIIDEYAEVETLLRELVTRSRLGTVFVSGSAHDPGNWGQERLELFARSLGFALLDAGYKLVSGFGLGVGAAVLLGAMEAAYSDVENPLSNRISLRPFPRTDRLKSRRDEFDRRWREEMISDAGFAVFLSGNRLSPGTDRIEVAPGVLQEFEMAVASRKYPIPIGATGFAARVLWERVMSRLDEFYPGLAVRRHFEILGDAERSNEDLVRAVVAVLSAVRGASTK